MRARFLSCLYTAIGGVILSLSVATTAPAEEYRSGFGFDIRVPDVFLALTQSEVGRHADLFDAGGGAVLDMVPPEMLPVMYQRISSGQLEIFYRQEGALEGFVDNVNVMLQATPLPENEHQLSAVCAILPGEFSRVFGRPISMDACEMRDVMGRRALYLEFDGAIAGTKTMQYQLEEAPEATLVLTATAAEPNLPRLMSEFESMVVSIRRD